VGCASPARERATILFFNDIHGHLKPYEVKTKEGKQKVGGIARMASLVNSIREENRARSIPTVLLFAGDLLQGTPMSTVFRGEPGIRCLNAMKLDAMTVGNHEFDFGLENLLRLRTMADFPMLSCNIVGKGTGKALCDSVAVIDLGGGEKLTVIGVTTKDLLVTTAPRNVARVDVADPIACVKAVLGEAVPAGPVVLLSHCRHHMDKAMARAFPGLVAIVAGHDHRLLDPVCREGDVVILQAFEKGRYLGRLDVVVDSGGRARVETWSYIPVTATVPGDPSVQGIVAEYERRLGNKFKEVIGRAEVFLDGDRRRTRYQETALGNLVADVMREHCGAEIALVNGGSIRESIGKGDITIEDVFKTMPFANEIVTMALTGEQVMAVLRRSVQGSQEDEDGGFLQVSGISFAIRGKEPVSVRVGPMRRPLAEKARYKVALTDFITSGGDGYTMFRGLPVEKTGSLLRELLVDTIRTRKRITAAIEGRIVRE
jgi:2',3'-cyclic-nucleotide 2'-phosphodiesterase (5'-nucleotidase family)